MARHTEGTGNESRTPRSHTHVPGIIGISFLPDTQHAMCSTYTYLMRSTYTSTLGESDAGCHRYCLQRHAARWLRRRLQRSTLMPTRLHQGKTPIQKLSAGQYQRLTMVPQQPYSHQHMPNTISRSMCGQAVDQAGCAEVLS